MKKFIFSLIFFNVLICINAAESDSDIFTYSVKYEEITISSVNNLNIRRLDIPQSIDGRAVKVIGRYAFAKCSNLRSVNLPDGLVRIEDGAFSECRSLEEIVIPDSVISIGDSAFESCTNLKKVVLSANLMTIATLTFAECTKLSQINITQNITSIESGAFANCKSLKKLVIPNPIINIDKKAFDGCDCLLCSDNICLDGQTFDKTSFSQLLLDNATVTKSDEFGAFENNKSTTIGSFQLGQYPVTQSLYSAVIGCDEVKDDIRPATNVSWYEAIAFCNKLSLMTGLSPCYDVDGISDWLALSSSDIPSEQSDAWDNVKFNYAASGYRLPTETEWEFAGRGADPSDDSSWNATFAESRDGQYSTNDVGEKTPNSREIYDMCGLVWQWCFDGERDNKGTFRINPVCLTGESRVLRGGVQNVPIDCCDIRQRQTQNSYIKSENVGFRLARSISSVMRLTAEFSDGFSHKYCFVKYGQRLEQPTSPHHDGLSFVGWFFDADDDEFFDFNSIITCDVTVRGKWVSLSQKTKAPEMVSVVRKHQVVSTLIDDDEGQRMLQPYQLSKTPVLRETFSAIMGYDPSDESSDFVCNLNYNQAITFCNKLSLRVGRPIVYSVDGVDDWVHLAYCDIPSDDVWNVQIDLDATGYRVPTEPELKYADAIDFEYHRGEIDHRLILARSIR